MGRAVVYVLILAAFAAFFVFSPSHLPDRNRQELTRRLGYKFRTPTFDPLVAELERIAEERELGSRGNAIGVEQTAKAKIPEAYRDSNDEGRLNISSRLVVLFPLVDHSPTDGLINYEEMSNWITEQTVNKLNNRTGRELAFYDKNGDGAISFHEYLPQFTEEDIARNETGHGQAGWWKQQFTNADVDPNGLLSFDELKDFLHPQDSSNYRIQNWLLSEKMKRMDYDRDGKLSFDEFLHHAYDIYKSYIEFETQGDDVPTAEEKFDELDLDEDEVLTVEELRPLFQYLNPGELSHAQHYAAHLINEADDNKDGFLTLEEMLKHEYVFYTTLYENQNGDYEDDFHDEL
ncbi:reticulocalbin-2 isoform X1 [Cucurbita moschata]|uniref:Reticulocalbin-2 isoform X1 n=1 Tax=Cucurbita moschata TaxID=3662 RepID=A0A6J1G0G2_CUCMO|nr:reticulocalbin-2 isoform X1 [Cucurbita moschata]